MTRRRVVSLVLFVAALVAGVFVWKFATQFPIYFQSHSHADLDSHQHQHTHETGVDHGHDHVGLLNSTTHSHEHQHRHQHSQTSQAEVPDGLVEIGHRHGENEVVTYWAKANADQQQAVLQFFQMKNDQLSETKPEEAAFEVKLLNGTELEAKLTVKSKDSGYSAKLPEKFFCLPGHSIRIENLEFEDKAFTAVIPLISKTN